MIGGVSSVEVFCDVRRDSSIGNNAASAADPIVRHKDVLIQEFEHENASQDMVCLMSRCAKEFRWSHRSCPTQALCGESHEFVYSNPYAYPTQH
jgi:hypothetical protein